MQNRHSHNIEQLNTHLNGSAPMAAHLSAAEYAEQIARHLARGGGQNVRNMRNVHQRRSS